MFGVGLHAKWYAGLHILFAWVKLVGSAWLYVALCGNAVDFCCNTAYSRLVLNRPFLRAADLIWVVDCKYLLSPYLLR